MEKMATEYQASASGNEAASADLQMKMEPAEMDLNKEKRKVEELELELDMLNAEKSQLSAKVSKVSGAKFQSLALQAKSTATELRSDYHSLRDFTADSPSRMSSDIGTI